MELVFQWENQTVKRINKKSISYLRRLSRLWKNKAKEREFGVLGYNFKWDDQGRPSLRTCHLNKAKEETNHMTIVGRVFEGEEIIQRVIHRNQPYVFKERGWYGWKREHEGESVGRWGQRNNKVTRCWYGPSNRYYWARWLSSRCELVCYCDFNLNFPDNNGVEL